MESVVYLQFKHALPFWRIGAEGDLLRTTEDIAMSCGMFLKPLEIDTAIHREGVAFYTGPSQGLLDKMVSLGGASVRWELCQSWRNPEVSQARPLFKSVARHSDEWR